MNWPTGASLYWKLVSVLLVLLVALGALSLWLTAHTSRLYFQEVLQQLDRDAAGHIAKNLKAFDGDQVDKNALKMVFMNVMQINPSMEVYLLDAQGAVLAYDAPEEKIVRRQVDLAPLREFLQAEAPTPILGTDPRSAGDRKVFTAAPVLQDGVPRGYLYIVLGGEAFEAVSGPLGRSYILRNSTWLGLGCLAIAVLVGLLAFARLTRPVRDLRRAMDEFQSREFGARVAVSSRDEIGQLGATFNRMADRIVLQMRQLRDTDQKRRDLVASISHDLRTPLASLQGHLESKLLREEQLSRDEHIQYTEVALGNARRLGRLVDDLFELAKLDAGEIEMQTERFSLPELLQDVLQDFRLRADEKGVGLTMRADPSLPRVSGDIGLIERVLDNLIDNALRCTPKGGNISVALLESEDRVEVRITDTGCGIPAEAIPRIFERFYRVDKSRSSDGTGLGLAISKRILDLHDSRIQVRSRENVGTSFSFTLAA